MSSLEALMEESFLRTISQQVRFVEAQRWSSQRDETSGTFSSLASKGE